MKKLFFILLISPIVGYSQVTSLPNSIGIGQNTLSTIPLHINKPGEVARLQGTSPYVSFYDGLNMNGYIQAINSAFEIGSKNNYPLDFYTGNQLRFYIGGNTGQAYFLRKLFADDGLQVQGNLAIYGPLSSNNNVGTSGQILTSNGSSAPTWETHKVGFEANGNIAGYNNNTETILSGFAGVSFNFGNGFNTSSGVFTAPTPGVYTFNLTLDIGITPSFTSNNPAIIRIFKNGSQWNFHSFLYSTHTGYGNSIQSTYIINLDLNDTVHFSFFQASGASLNVRPRINGYTVL